VKYGYITLFAMASVVACAVPTSSSEQDNSVQSASASCGAAYAQCGGQGFTGPTCCVSGNTCTYSNQWYSQCVPGGGGGSSSGGSSSSSGGSKGGGTGCTAGSSQDALQRAAATTALNLMRLVAPSAPTGWTQDYPLNQTQAFSILASQRYRVLSSGTGIEFDPNDSVYSYVTNAMQAELAFAQMDSNVAKFLSDGLKNAHSTTDGQVFPSIRAIAGLANYTDSGPTTVHIADPTTSDGQHHTVTVTTLPAPKCGEPTINFAEQVETSWQFSPLFAENYSDFNRNGQTPAILGFTGSSHRPATPFNGPSGKPAPCRLRERILGRLGVVRLHRQRLLEGSVVLGNTPDGPDGIPRARRRLRHDRRHHGHAGQPLPAHPVPAGRRPVSPEQLGNAGRQRGSGVGNVHPTRHAIGRDKVHVRQAILINHPAGRRPAALQPGRFTNLLVSYPGWGLL